MLDRFRSSACRYLFACSSSLGRHPRGRRRALGVLPPKRPAVPEVQERILGAQSDRRGSSWRSSERQGLRPAAEADRATLLRRLSFDLTGLAADARGAAIDFWPTRAGCV